MNQSVFLEENGIKYRWKVITIWDAAKTLDPILISIEEIVSQLDNDRWFRHYQEPTARNILPHVVRVINADLSYPIIISPMGSILDGVHRLMKAVILDKKTIMAIRLHSLPPSDSENIDI